MGFAERSANLLMAAVFMAPVLASISSLEEVSSPYLKHNSVIKDRKNKHPFGLNAQVEISLCNNCPIFTLLSSSMQHSKTNLSLFTVSIHVLAIIGF